MQNTRQGISPRVAKSPPCHGIRQARLNSGCYPGRPRYRGLQRSPRLGSWCGSKIAPASLPTLPPRNLRSRRWPTNLAVARWSAVRTHWAAALKAQQPILRPPRYDERPEFVGFPRAPNQPQGWQEARGWRGPQPSPATLAPRKCQVPTPTPHPQPPPDGSRRCSACPAVARGTGARWAHAQPR